MLQANLGYAQALFEIAVENKVVDQFLDQAKTLSAVIKQHEELDFLLKGKTITKEEKKDLLDKIFTQEIHPLLITGLKLMVDHSKFSNLEKTLRELIHLIHEHLGVQIGVIYSIKKLPQESIDKVQKRLSKILNKNTQLTNLIDKELIGGLKVVVDNKVYDNTLLTQLQNLKSEMMKGK